MAFNRNKTLCHTSSLHEGVLYNTCEREREDVSHMHGYLTTDIQGICCPRSGETMPIYKVQVTSPCDTSVDTLNRPGVILTFHSSRRSCSTTEKEKKYCNFGETTQRLPSTCNHAQKGSRNCSHPLTATTETTHLSN